MRNPSFSLVGALRGITKSQPHVITALQLGVALGLVIEILRKMIKRLPEYAQFAKESRVGLDRDSFTNP